MPGVASARLPAMYCTILDEGWLTTAEVAAEITMSWLLRWPAAEVAACLCTTICNSHVHRRGPVRPLSCFAQVGVMARLLCSRWIV